MVVVEVRQGPLQDEEEEEEEEKEKEKETEAATNIKSNNPPLAGGEQEKPTNPNANHMKDKKQNHVKRSVYSVECGVSSVECKVWSVKWEVWSVEWKAWSGKCRVPSVARQVRSECGV